MNADAQQIHPFVIDALAESRCWSERVDEAALADLPGHPAVCLFVDGAGRPVQLATTQQLRGFARSRLLEQADASRARADLGEIVRGMRWREVHSSFEARWWYYRAARCTHPRGYRKMIAFGPAWYLHVDWSQPVPDIRATEHVWQVAGDCAGPWPTRAACHAALEQLWDLFDLCRYPEQVRRAPHGQRCAYADMGRCDAPCDGTVPVADYTQRCREAWSFVMDGPAGWIEQAAPRMRALAERREFERAAVLKQQIETAENWRKPRAVPIRARDAMISLLAIPVTRRKKWKLFLLRLGCLSDGPILSDKKLAPETCAWLTARLSEPLPQTDDLVRSEQSWLTAHFMHHRDAGGAITVDLPDGVLPENFEIDLADQLTARRARPEAAESSPPA